MNYEYLDEAMLPFHSFMKSLTEFEGMRSEKDLYGMTMGIERVQIETPIELQVATMETGAVILGSVPPLYHVDTSIQPVFHFMRITIEVIKTVEPDLYDQSEYILEP